MFTTLTVLLNKQLIGDINRETASQNVLKTQHNLCCYNKFKQRQPLVSHGTRTPVFWFVVCCYFIQPMRLIVMLLKYFVELILSQLNNVD